jgi:hypothetical protein
MSKSGQSLIEVTVGLVIFVPVLLVLIDLSTIFLGVQANDNTCRNAVQAAASGDPAQATARAMTVVTRSNQRGSGPIVSHFNLVQPVEVQITNRPATEFDPLSEKQKNTGGAVTGTATVTTEVDIKPFVVQVVYGGKSPLKFRARKSFPISFIQPAG